MTIQEIIGTPDLSPNDTIKILQNGRIRPQPPVETIRKQYDVHSHDVFNKKKRPDKIVKPDENTVKVEPVSRIGLSLQSLVVERAVAFLFGNDIKLVPAGDDTEPCMAAIARVNAENKINAFNKQIARALFTATEVAEYWYAVPTDRNSNYGFTANEKLRCTVFSPLNGDYLYPFFDEYGDLIAFSRKYWITGNTGKTVQMFEAWTDAEYRRYSFQNSWTEITDAFRQNKTGKMPIVYTTQPNPEWHNVQSLIDRLEKLLSNFADTNDYFASPLLFINGDIAGFAGKGETGKIIQGDTNANAQYLAWSQLPEPIQLEINILLRFIFSLTQTPDISFESVKGLGNTISGETLKMLFLDAHLKAQNKMEIMDSYITRRYNIIKSQLKALNDKLNVNFDIDIVITPYMTNIDSTTISNLVSAFNGGIMSLETAVQNNPYVADGAAEVSLIRSEETEQ